ncbi:MAG: hypothetical protein JW940_36210 [Polyangiaceae bacterium]|nr:hypothetical protein [Polyangiaceae bacterium]
MLVMILLVASFALVATAHVALVLGLAVRAGVWRALAALVAVPLAPLWGQKYGLFVRTWIWLGALVLYGGALLASLG